MPPAADASHFRRPSTYELIGTLVPLVVVCWIAHSQVLSFDGAMNMQVARNLAVDHVFGRDYGGMELFPPEIQTSSYFLALSALAIALFGTSNLTLQAANLVFAAALLFATARAGSPSRLAALLLPSVLLFGTPGLLSYSLGGYGEGAVAALALIAFLLIARALVEPARSVRLVVLAFVAIGTAISIKTVAVAILVPALLGVVAVAVTQGRPRRTRLLLTPLAVAIPLAAFEIYRLAVLGDAYVAYWRSQLDDILYQAGGGSGRTATASQGIVAKVADHMHLLATQTGIPAEWWAVALVAAPLGVALVASWHRTWSTDETRRFALLTMLVVYAELYFVWWLAITPNEKAWLRRVTIGVFALLLGLALVAGLVMARLRRTIALPTLPRLLAALGLAAVLVPVGVVVANGLVRTVPSVGADGRQERALDTLAQDVADLSDDGAQFYGVGWWSAPVVSLYSGVEFDNLGATDLCGPEAKPAVDAGEAYLVWDFYAKNLSNSPVPGWPGVELEPTGISTDYGALWRISLPAGSCVGAD